MFQKSVHQFPWKSAGGYLAIGARFFFRTLPPRLPAHAGTAIHRHPGIATTTPPG